MNQSYNNAAGIGKKLQHTLEIIKLDGPIPRRKESETKPNTYVTTKDYGGHSLTLNFPEIMGNHKPSNFGYYKNHHCAVMAIEDASQNASSNHPNRCLGFKIKKMKKNTSRMCWLVFVRLIFHTVCAECGSNL